MSEMTALEIVVALAKSDPVYGPVRGPKLPEPSTQHASIRICALCGRRSGHNQENISHTPSCPWISAREYLK